MLRMQVSAALLLGLQILVTGCGHGSGILSNAGGTDDGRPAPVRVEPFEAGRPELVLIVTGHTSGLLEVCNCQGPMLGGMANRSGLIHSYRAAADDAVVLDLGNCFWIEPGDLRNEYVVKGFDLIDYDALVVGSHEWACEPERFSKLFAPADFALLSSNVRRGKTNVDLQKVFLKSGPWGKLAILSYTPPGVLQFLPGAAALEVEPLESVADSARKLKRDGHIVVLAVHGFEADVRKAAAEVSAADLILRGNTRRTNEHLKTVAGVPVARIGGREMVGILALQLKDRKLESIEFRPEVIDGDWPVDDRLLKNFQSYIKEAERQSKTSADSR
ncbi:MAG: hypothetical protein ACLFVU_13940 [Phycisphaerae bacterium]